MAKIKIAQNPTLGDPSLSMPAALGVAFAELECAQGPLVEQQKSVFAGLGALFGIDGRVEAGDVKSLLCVLHGSWPAFQPCEKARRSGL